MDQQMDKQETIGNSKTVAELIERVMRFPGEVDIQPGATERNMISWVNGHCFMWKRGGPGEEWECDEL